MNESILPAPEPEDLAVSLALRQQICSAIDAANGQLPFSDYMQLCLYSPGLGYYSAGKEKFGAAGDFITAPDISPLFAAALARHCVDALQQTENGIVLEFGAGNGQLATDLLTQFVELECLPSRYCILETSPSLAEAQQQTIFARHPDLTDRVVWLDSLPASFQGVVIANEVCDAMPVHRLEFTSQGCFELAVTDDGDNLRWCHRRLPIQLQAFADQIQQLNQGARPYVTEVPLVASAWLNSLAETLQQGAVFIIDYGYPASEYYLPERDQGTLRCYYQHQAHDNPLILHGLQDITTHVNFSALTETALSADLDVSGFHYQKDFLLAGGLAELASEQMASSQDVFTQMKMAAALKRLLLPGQMGESFKVLSLSRDIELSRLCPMSDKRYLL